MVLQWKNHLFGVCFVKEKNLFERSVKNLHAREGPNQRGVSPASREPLRNLETLRLGHTVQEKDADLHGGDVLKQVRDAGVGSVALASGLVQRQQREEGTLVGLIAEDLRAGAAAGGRAVQDGAERAVQDGGEQQEPPPAHHAPAH